MTTFRTTNDDLGRRRNSWGSVYLSTESLASRGLPSGHWDIDDIAFGGAGDDYLESGVGAFADLSRRWSWRR